MKKFDNLLQTAAKNAAEQRQSVQVLAGVLAQWMEKMHGGEWAAAIDHKAGFVLIRQKTAGPVTKRELREAI